MFQELDNALTALLQREMTRYGKGQLVIDFEPPTREWSAKLGGKGTLNLFLYDVRENTRLRQMGQPWERVPPIQKDKDIGEQRRPLRVDVHYALTAWAKLPSQAHDLLGNALQALLRHPCFPADLLPNQPGPVTLQVAQNDVMEKPTDLWSVLNNDLHPTVPITVTLVLQPPGQTDSDAVKATDFTFMSPEVDPDTGQYKKVTRTDKRDDRRFDDVFGGTGAKRKATQHANVDTFAYGASAGRPAGGEKQPGSRHVPYVRGLIRASQPGQVLRDPQVHWLERNKHLGVDDDGGFALFDVLPGDCTVHISARNATARQFTMTIPLNKPHIPDKPQVFMLDVRADE